MKPRFECRVDLVVAALRPWEVKIARVEVQAALMGLLGALRRALAGDSSVHLPVGALSHFDAACANLGVPPLAALSAPEGELMNLSFEGWIDLAAEVLVPWETRILRADIQGAFRGFLTDLRRGLAGDGPGHRPAGALEHFDAACEGLCVPFLEP